jgi:hypothetical protein
LIHVNNTVYRFIGQNNPSHPLQVGIKGSGWSANKKPGDFAAPGEGTNHARSKINPVHQVWEKTKLGHITDFARFGLVVELRDFALVVRDIV